MKKEERVQLFQRLTYVTTIEFQTFSLLTMKHRETQAQVSPLVLQSTATLGSGQPQTHAERLALQEDKEVRREIDGRSSSRRKRRKLAPSGAYADLLDPVEKEDQDEEFLEQEPRAVTQWPTLSRPATLALDSPQNESRVSSSHSSPQPTSHSPTQKHPPPTFEAGNQLGAGLKRNADGTIVVPRVVPKRPKEKERHRMTVCLF